MQEAVTIVGYRNLLDKIEGDEALKRILEFILADEQAHHAFFQIVMLAYNLWRWMKWLASQADPSTPSGHPKPERPQRQLPDHTIRIARLKMLYVAAKIVVHGNRDEVRYSEHEQRASGLIDFLQYLDRRRAEAA